MSNGCDSGLYLNEDVLPILTIHIVPFLASCVVLCGVAIVVGYVSCKEKRVYKLWATTAAEIVVKIGLIPEVEVKMKEEDENSTTPTTGGDAVTSEIFWRRNIELTDLREHSKDIEGGVVGKTNTSTQEGVVKGNSGETVQLFQRRGQGGGVSSKKKWPYKESVCFSIRGELFPVRHTFPVMAFPMAIVLITCYVSIFVTAQWHQTDTCGDTDSVTEEQKVCFYIPECSNTINCTAWKLAGRTEKIICRSLSLDIFEPLIKFVSLLAVQVTIMTCGILLFNRGCPCVGDNTWKRYLGVCLFDLAFVGLLFGIGIYLLVDGINRGDVGEVFIRYIIPIGHMVFVSIAETLFLFVFTVMLFLGPIFSERIDQDDDEESGEILPSHQGQSEDNSQVGRVIRGNYVGELERRTFATVERHTVHRSARGLYRSHSDPAFYTPQGETM